MTSITIRTVQALAVLAAVFSPLAASAKSANSLGDLVGARAAGAESDMQSRGWRQVDAAKSSNASYSFWWNPGRHDCVMVKTADGRYAAITDATPAECNQTASNGYESGYRGGGSGGGSGGGQYGSEGGGEGPPPKVILHKNGTASATLPHCLANYDKTGRKTSSFSSCRDEDLRRMSIAVAASMREQGMGSDQGERSEGYGERNQSYGERNGPGPVDFSDLVGAKAAGVDSDLQSRGFRNVDGFQSGSNGKGTIWWNGRTRQCLQMITVNGRADSIEDIHTHQNCR